MPKRERDGGDPPVLADIGAPEPSTPPPPPPPWPPMAPAMKWDDAIRAHIEIEQGKIDEYERNKARQIEREGVDADTSAWDRAIAEEKHRIKGKKKVLENPKDAAKMIEDERRDLQKKIDERDRLRKSSKPADRKRAEELNREIIDESNVIEGKKTARDVLKLTGYSPG